ARKRCRSEGPWRGRADARARRGRTLRRLSGAAHASVGRDGGTAAGRGGGWSRAALSGRERVARRRRRARERYAALRATAGDDRLVRSAELQLSAVPEFLQIQEIAPYR